MRSDISLETRLAWKIKDIHNQHATIAKTVLGSRNLHPGQPRILSTIEETGGASQGELADRLQVSQASLAMSIKRLEKGNFVSKQASRLDRRVNRIWLTNYGSAALEYCRQEMKKVDQRMLANFTGHELEQLTGYLDRILQNISDIKLAEWRAKISKLLQDEE